MMIRKVPIAAAHIPLAVLLKGLGGFGRTGSQEACAAALAAYTGRRHALLVNSGIAAVLLTLQTLSRGSSRREIILPAYTAGSLVVSVRQAGLVPVLCDIDLRSAGLSGEQLPDLVTNRTLAIIGVHLFGLVESGLASWKKNFPGVFVIEDACQAMGSTWQGEPVGQWGDVSVFSFNKGKNMPTVNGGVILTDNDDLAQRLKIAITQLAPASHWLGAERWVQMLALSVVTQPFVYGLVHPLLGRYREVAPPERIHGARYTEVQAALGMAMLARVEQQAQQRYENAMTLMAGLRDTDGVSLFTVSADSRPALNRLPILVHDASRRERIEQSLSRQGIETSRFYLTPLHRMFDLGYSPDDFPQSRQLAERLLTIPCHPLVSPRNCDTIITSINNEMLQKR